MHDERFILASASPRRRELLASAGLSFSVEPSQADESPHPGEDAAAYARRVATEKAREVATRARARGDARPVLAADTTVVVDGELLGKPRDQAEARSMLERLSGRPHQVITGTCLIDAGGAELTDAIFTEVRFRALEEEDLARYLASGEWRDKAGAYAIQGHAACLVSSICGSYTNVVGLPLAEVVEALAWIGIRGAVGGTGGEP